METPKGIQQAWVAIQPAIHAFSPLHVHVHYSVNGMFNYLEVIEHCVFAAVRFTAFLHASATQNLASSS